MAEVGRGSPRGRCCGCKEWSRACSWTIPGSLERLVNYSIQEGRKNEHREEMRYLRNQFRRIWEPLMNIHSSDSFTKHVLGSNYPAIIGACQGQTWKDRLLTGRVSREVRQVSSLRGGGL